MADIIFYNKTGKPIAWLSDKDDETIYLFNGKAVAYLYNDSVYSFNGEHLGFFLNGWIYDNSGYCVFFTANATGGPVKPIKHVCPIKGVTSIKPVKSSRRVPPIKPVKKLSWKDSDDFF